MEWSLIVSPLITALIVSLVINLSMFMVAFRLQSDKLTDISYAVTFVVIGTWAFTSSESDWGHIILLTMICLWALRLGGFLLYRVIKNGKDARFDGMRENFGKFGKFWLAQAVTVWIVMISSIFAFEDGMVLSKLSFVGMFIWLIGLLFETTADFQKQIFSSDRRNKNKWIESGVWKYSRHPNYFGEILVWTGSYLYVVSSLSPLQAIIGIVSPGLIVILLLFVSGIPILEGSADKRWSHIDAYQVYKKRTSILIPLPRRRH